MLNPRLEDKVDSDIGLPMVNVLESTQNCGSIFFSVDSDPQDPHVFGSSGSGSISQRYRSGSISQR
jgi:hypothetical protein